MQSLSTEDRQCNKLAVATRACAGHLYLPLCVRDSRGFRECVAKHKLRLLHVATWRVKWGITNKATLRTLQPLAN